MNPQIEEIRDQDKKIYIFCTTKEYQRKENILKVCSEKKVDNLQRRTNRYQDFQYQQWKPEHSRMISSKFWREIIANLDF